MDNVSRHRPLLPLKKSIIPALDMKNIGYMQKVVSIAAGFKEIVAYKIGFALGLTYGLKNVTKAIKTIHPEAIVIYDHQKAGTDIPDTGRDFAETMVAGGVDIAILFPQAGPATQKAWINALQKTQIGVIVGGEMTHPQYKKSDGGYIDDDKIPGLYALAADLGVYDFVVPGNRPHRIAVYAELFRKKNIQPAFYSPGLVAQGGDIGQAVDAAGANWHAICGRAIYNPRSLTEDRMSETPEQEICQSIQFLIHQLGT